jgi:hypothetical protein
LKGVTGDNASLSVQLTYDLNNLPSIPGEIPNFVQKIDLNWTQPYPTGGPDASFSQIIYGPGVRGVPIDVLACGESLEINRYNFYSKRIELNEDCHLPQPAFGIGGIVAKLSLTAEGIVTITETGKADLEITLGACH